MKRIIYLLPALIFIATQILNAQQGQPVKAPLGAPVIVNFMKAAEYDRLHPKKEKIHDVEQGDDEMEASPVPEQEPQNPVKNNVPVIKYQGNMVQGVPSPAPALTFVGDSLKTTFPPDIRGAAGLAHVVHTTNQVVKIFSKTGAVISTASLATFLAASGGSGFYDPHIVFDTNNNKFIFVCGGKLSNSHSGLFLAVTQTSDPTGSWYIYPTDGTNNTSDLFDYPLLGFNSNWIVVTGNLFAGGTTFASCKIVVYDRAAVYNGSSSGAINIFTDASHITTIAPAVTIDNNQPIEYLVQNSTGNSGGYGYVLLSTITGPVGSPVYALSNSVGVNQPWSNQYVTVPQKGATTATYLDMRDARIGNVVYRNGSLWFAHHVFMPATTPNHSAVDWWQINPATSTVIQFGRVDDPGDTLFYFYPGIDVNALGDVLLTYCVSSANMYASSAYALHSAADAPGTMKDTYIYKSGIAYYVRLSGGRNRWGDYTCTAVDPADGSFWSFCQWASKNNVWATQIAHVIATPDTICHEPAATTAINVTDTSATVTWSATSSGTFTFQYRKTGASTWTTVNTSSTSYVIYGLTPNTTYEWQVLTHCPSGGTSVFTSITTFTTLGPCVTKGDFTATPILFCSAPATVTFSNTSSNATTYIWYFGDGGTSTSANPSHTYNSFGKYTVKLVATGCTLDSITKVQYVNIDSTIACSVSLPTLGAGPTQTGCAGNLYDSGGPVGNYQNKTDVSIVIAPSGASTVTLNFVSFAFESTYDFLYIYDGPNSSYPLLGQFSGYIIPAPITSSGGYVTIRQTSDDSLNYSGFALSWQCNIATSKPVANFTADNTSSCTGTINFTDLSTNGPTSWFWDFGDGNTSSLRNPTHTYTTSGVYNVVLTSTNSYGSDSKTLNNYITINLPTPPVVLGSTTVCSGNYTVLTANGTPQITWFNVPTGGTPINTGSIFITPPLFSPTTYYVESDIYPPSQYVGPASYAFGTGGYFTQTNYHNLYFDVYSPITLVSVQVYAGAAGNRTITLIQNSITLQSVVVNLPAGASKVTLNFSIPPGTKYELGVSGNQNLYRNTSGSLYPYTINGLVSITGDNSGLSGYYYYFYNWEVQAAPCKSARVPVNVGVSNGPTSSFTFNLLANIGTFSNTSFGAATYHWDFGDPGSGVNDTSSLPNPTHVFSDVGSYYVCLNAIDVYGCSKSSCQFITVLSVGVVEMTSDRGISIYPNPVNKMLSVSFTNAYLGNKWTLQLSDVLGNIVAEKIIQSVVKPGNYDWDVSILSSGTYFLILQSDHERLIKRIIRD